MNEIEDLSKLYDTDLNKFCDFTEYVQQLEKLKKLDLSISSLDDIHKAFYDHAIIYPHIFGTHSPENFNRLTFYRVRMNVDKTKEDINLIRTFSYPSATFCKDNGKANLKGKAVFYCSNNPFAAIFESKPNVDEVGYLSVWKPNTDRNMKIGICLSEHLRKENIWQEMANEAHQFAKNQFKKTAKDKYQHLNHLNQFIADRFVNENPPYPLTSWLANEMLYGEAWKDFIIYPSIASNSYYCNMAFHPNITDKYLKFEKVIRFKVIQIQNESLKISTGRLGEIKNTNIEWRQATKEEIDLNNFPN